MLRLYCKIGREILGPMSPDELKAMVARGELAPDDLVRRESDDEWVQARRLKHLRFCAVANQQPEQVTVETQRSEPDKQNHLLTPRDRVVWLIALLCAPAITCFGSWVLGCYTLLIWSLWITTLILAGGIVVVTFGGVQTQKVENGDQGWNAMAVLMTVSFLLFLWTATRDWAVNNAAIAVSDIGSSAAVLEISATEADAADSIRSIAGHGTAFVYDEQEGKLRLFTNAHNLVLFRLAVIGTSSPNKGVDVADYKLLVGFPTGKTRRVERIAVVSGHELDAAQLEVDATGLVAGEDYVIVPYVENIVERLEVMPGDSVITVGTPVSQEFSGTQSFGQVSAVRESIQESRGPWIQHDAKTTGGNSGGPLFLKEGDRAYWIGVNTLGTPDSQINLALSADAVTDANYVWAEATPTGVAKLIHSEFGVDALATIEPTDINWTTLLSTLKTSHPVSSKNSYWTWIVIAGLAWLFLAITRNK